MARATAPMLSGLRVSTRTTRKRSNAGGDVMRLNFTAALPSFCVLRATFPSFAVASTPHAEKPFYSPVKLSRICQNSVEDEKLPASVVSFLRLPAAVGANPGSRNRGASRGIRRPAEWGYSYGSDCYTYQHGEVGRRDDINTTNGQSSGG